MIKSMAIIKNPEDLSNASNYVATIAFFCCISCVTLMLRFGGFKASLNIFNGKKKKESNNTESGLYMTGAYRTNRDEFFGNGRLSDPPRKITPSMVNLPSREGNLTAIRPTKSTGDLTKSNSTQEIRQSTPNVSAKTQEEDGNKIPKNSSHNRKSQDKEQKRLEKQRLNEQREREKAAAKEQARQEKLKEKARKEAVAKTKKDKRKAPQPVKANPLAQSSMPQMERPNPMPQAHKAYSTNTLESSISRSSGPPPYSERPHTDVEQHQNATTSTNITFGKSIDTSSWDMITEHRQQVSKTTNDGNKYKKQTTMDLNYKFSNVIQKERDNSEV